MNPQVTATVVACGASRNASGMHVCSGYSDWKVPRAGGLKPFRQTRERPRGREYAFWFKLATDPARVVELVSEGWPEPADDDDELDDEDRFSVECDAWADEAWQRIEALDELVRLLQVVGVGGRRPQRPPAVARRRVRPEEPPAPRPPPLDLVRSLTVAPLAP